MPTGQTDSPPGTRSFLSHLECALCEARHPADQVQTVCTACGASLLCIYDLDAARPALAGRLPREPFPGMWRYSPLLPVQEAANIVSLGEGLTPLLPAATVGAELGLSRLLIKDDGQCPTGSFKARGLSAAVSRAKELGLQHLAIPSAGNAAGALAAYGARAGLGVSIFMPADAPDVNKQESIVTGAEVTLVNGFISDAGKLAAAGAPEHGWFIVSTLKEPYRLEGKKTMGLELAEQLPVALQGRDGKGQLRLPDVIVYPTGGGTGLIGMWKAFAEMEQLGLIGPDRPRMVSVQAAGCAPIVKAFEEGSEVSEPWQDPHTCAAGLRVPHAFADRLILRAIRDSGGMAVAVTDEEILIALRNVARKEGIVACPEGAATIAGLARLRESGLVRETDCVVAFNTGTGLKYPDALPPPEAPVVEPR